MGGLERQFRARPQAFPAAYRGCIIAGVRRLTPRQVSRFVIGAIARQRGRNTAITQIAGRCQAAFASR